MLISRFLCADYLLKDLPHCEIQCPSCKAVTHKQESSVGLNEEKSPRFFVWEKRQTEIKGIQYAPAIYAQKPMTGMGLEKDKDKYVFILEILSEENDWNLNQLCDKYPAPPKPV